MFGFFKKLFNFGFKTSLTVSDCQTRLTGEYQKLLESEGRLRLSDYCGGLGFEIKRSNEVRVAVAWFRTYLYYHVSFERIQQGTILRCRHFPFNFLGLFMPGALTLFFLSGCLISFFAGDMSNALVSAVLSIPFLIVCFVGETSSRAPFERYLSKFLDCEPLKD